LPGVRAAGAASAPPFTGMGAATSFEIEGQPPVPRPDRPTTDVRVVDQDYFRTLSIPLLKGRTFSDREVVQESRVIIINETLARQHFANEDPLGKRLIVAMKDQNNPCEIIGVVGDVKFKSLDQAVRPMVYWPHSELAYGAMTLVIKTSGNPLAIADAVQREVRALDKDQPVSEMRPMEALLADSISRSRFATLLLSIFAAVAFGLASVGIYGVMSYSVTQRTNEIGIRIALGASRINVLGLVLRRGLMLAACGVVVGLAGSFALTRLLTTQLFGVSATDPVTFTMVSLTLMAVALLATYLPARRAMKLDPLVALRYE